MFWSLNEHFRYSLCFIRFLIWIIFGKVLIFILEELGDCEFFNRGKMGNKLYASRNM